MRVAILGRTGTLLEAARRLVSDGVTVPLVGTCAPASYDGVGPDAFEAFAREAGAVFFSDARINSPAIVESLRAAACDVALSINWLTVVEREACEAFPHGILNVHAGDLPRYRGNACPNWAILNGESHVGLTIHRMRPGELDAGAIVAQVRMPIDHQTYIGDVHAWLEGQVPGLCVDVVRQIAAGTARFVEQDPDPSAWLRCYPRRSSDGLIDWAAPAVAVHRLVRASSRPFDGAFTFLEGRQLVRVWRAELATHRGAFLAVPGQVIGRTDAAVLVACGDGVLALTEIEVDGMGGADARALVSKSLRNRLAAPLHE